MRRFNPSSTHPARAVQAWQILVGRAMNRQSITYEGLAELIGYGKESKASLLTMEWDLRLALQLRFCFEVRALSGGLVCSAPE